MRRPGRVIGRIGSLEFELGQNRHIAQKVDRISIDVSRPGVAGAESSNAASGNEQREARVEADARTSRHQRIVGEPRILECVRHNQHLARGYGVSTERDLPRGLPELQSMDRLEPLAISVHEADEGHGHAQNCSRKARETIEALLLGRIEDAQAMKSRQPLLLVLG